MGGRFLRNQYLISTIKWCWEVSLYGIAFRLASIAENEVSVGFCTGSDLPCFRRDGSTIFREANEVEMVVMIGKNRFGLVTEVHEEPNVSGSAQHGTGIKLVGIGGPTFNLPYQSLPHSLTLMSGAHGKQSDHADAGHGPETHGADDRSSFFRHKNMFLSRILFQALEGFRGPAADLVNAGIFAERELLHLKESRKVNLRRWSNVNHKADPVLGIDSVLPPRKKEIRK